MIVVLFSMKCLRRGEIELDLILGDRVLKRQGGNGGTALAVAGVFQQVDYGAGGGGGQPVRLNSARAGRGAHVERDELAEEGSSQTLLHRSSICCIGRCKTNGEGRSPRGGSVVTQRPRCRQRLAHGRPCRRHTARHAHILKKIADVGNGTDGRVAS